MITTIIIQTIDFIVEVVKEKYTLKKSQQIQVICTELFFDDQFENVIFSFHLTPLRLQF